MGNALYADPPVATGRGSVLQFELADGTVVTGRIDVKAIAIRIATADGKNIRLRCLGPDRIVGALGPKTTISFKTDKGKVDVPAGRIAALAAHRTLILDLGKGVTMKLAGIPAGQFVMGSPKSEKDHKDHESPRHRVVIGKPFYMGVTEVTQAQYERVMGRNPSKVKSPGNPVEEVTWKDAAAFCTALSKKTGRAAGLPTEAQWEYAYRAGTKARFSMERTKP